MQERLQLFAQKAIANKKITLGVLFGLLATSALAFTMTIPSKDSLAKEDTVRPIGGSSEVEIAIAGATSSLDTSAVGNSWPGELISLGSVPIQPAREGTIATWDVHIGQTVFAGQTIGTLTRPPATPELVAMLAEHTAALAKAKNDASAERTYIETRIMQLKALRESIEGSRQTTKDIIGTGQGDHATLSTIEVKKKVARAALSNTIATTYPLMGSGATIPQTYNAIQLRASYGAQNSSLRATFPIILFAAISDLNDPEKIPTESGLAYFEAAIKLTNATIPDGSTLTDSSFSTLNELLRSGQSSFIAALDDINKTELEVVDGQKTYIEQLKDIDAQIAELEKNLAVSEGEVMAKHAAHETVANAINGGYAIVAPRSGTISSIMKKPGEFVSPGMPLAVVTGNKSNELIVRFRIPNNVRRPEISKELSVTRPGFPEDARQARLIGVGGALDDDGSIMADALLLDPVDWPVGAALRVIAPSDADTIMVALSSVWWNAKGEPNVWAVSSAGRIYAKTIKLGRTLGEKIEVYSGLMRGDQYVVKPTPEIAEDMLIGDIKGPETKKQGEQSYEDMMRAMGM